MYYQTNILSVNLYVHMKLTMRLNVELCKFVIDQNQILIKINDQYIFSQSFHGNEAGVF